MPHCDEEWVESHICVRRHDLPDWSGLYGPSVTDVHVGKSGWFWLENGEYATAAAFCPFCNIMAPALQKIRGIDA